MLDLYYRKGEQLVLKGVRNYLVFSAYMLIDITTRAEKFRVEICIIALVIIYY